MKEEQEEHQGDEEISGGGGGGGEEKRGEDEERKERGKPALFGVEHLVSILSDTRSTSLSLSPRAPSTVVYPDISAGSGTCVFAARPSYEQRRRAEFPLELLLSSFHDFFYEKTRTTLKSAPFRAFRVKFPKTFRKIIIFLI